MSDSLVGPGTFTCAHADSKTSYCVGDVITYTLAISESNSTTFDHPIYGSALMDCQVRGENGINITRSGDRRGFFGPCYPSVNGKNLQDFLNEGGKGTFTVPAENYIGFSQRIDLYFYYEKKAGTMTSTFYLNAYCPEFSVSQCSSSSASTATTSSTISSLAQTEANTIASSSTKIATGNSAVKSGPVSVFLSSSLLAIAGFMLL